MFAFAPAYNQYYPDQRPQRQGFRVSPRERYLAALAEQQEAEADYVAALAREEYLRKRSEEDLPQAYTYPHHHRGPPRHPAHYGGPQHWGPPYHGRPVHREGPPYHWGLPHHRRPRHRSSYAEEGAYTGPRFPAHHPFAHYPFDDYEAYPEEEHIVHRVSLANHPTFIIRRVPEQEDPPHEASLDEFPIEQFLQSLFGVSVKEAIAKKPKSGDQQGLSYGPSAGRERSNCASQVAPGLKDATCQSTCNGRCARRVPPSQARQVGPQQAWGRLLGELVGGASSSIGPRGRCQRAGTCSRSTDNAQPKEEPVPQKTAPQGNTELADGIQHLLSALFGAQQGAEAGPSRPKPTTSSEKPSTSNAPAPASMPSLKEQLEARLYSDPDTEMRDISQALLASLATVVAPSAADEANGKGKAKEILSETNPVSTVPSAQDARKALDTLNTLSATFHSLETDFVFPHQLDFDSTPSSPTPSVHSESSGSSLVKLAFTARNAPVRYYEHALSALLVDLDAVESHGFSDVRERRKEIVGLVERALESVEAEVQGRLDSWLKKRPSVDGRKEEAEADSVHEQGTNNGDVAEPGTQPTEVTTNDNLEIVLAESGSIAAPESTATTFESTHTHANVDSPTTPVTSDVSVPEGEAVNDSRSPTPATTDSQTVEVEYGSSPRTNETESHSEPDAEASLSDFPAAVDYEGEERSVASSTATITAVPISSLASNLPSNGGELSAEIPDDVESPDTFLLGKKLEAHPAPKQAPSEEDVVVVYPSSDGDWSEIEA